ncbi:MAG: hypothetical protein R3250_15925 [Melioribacteraceae bacterium]|nr:hypothetical protein [Melioribacteraceae bacterium]
MIKNIIENIVCLFLVFVIVTPGQNTVDISRLKSDFAKGENKEKYYSNLLKNIDQTFSGDPSVNSGIWIKALRDAQSMKYDGNDVKVGLEKIFEMKIDNNLKLQRIALEIAYTLFKGDFNSRIEKIATETNDEISFAISVHYLKNRHNIKKYLKTALQKFGEQPESSIIKYLVEDLRSSDDLIPDLRELLNHKFQKGKTIIFSFHRKNRIYPGITIIKKPNGEFVKKKNGDIFNIPQLALSYSNLPEYIPSGNTPQGIYSIQGTYISPTETIGPTPNVLTRIPFEITPSLFYHKSNSNNKWEIDDYKKLLPLSWKDYDPIFNSFNIGKFGRRLIIIHGSTDETAYFSEEAYYPLTPTRGCLSSREIWDEKTGRAVESDQVSLINAFRSTGQTKGYLILIEIDDQQRPVDIQDIKRFLK